MFTKDNLDTLVFKILIDNPEKWFDQYILFEELKKYYNNNDELFIGHFLFLWYKLLNNTKFISNINYNNHIIITIKLSTTLINIINKKPYLNISTFNDYQFNDLTINKQIYHMITYPELYINSSLIEQYLLLIINSSKYISLYDILLDHSLNINNNDIVKFINIYCKNNPTNNPNNNPTNNPTNNLINNPNNSYNLKYLHIFGVSSLFFPNSFNIKIDYNKVNYFIIKNLNKKPDKKIIKQMNETINNNIKIFINKKLQTHNNNNQDLIINNQDQKIITNNYFVNTIKFLYNFIYY